MKSFFLGVAEQMMPVLQQSAFLEKGVLTPSEFVSAGDYLVSKCPSWGWSKSPPSCARNFLPENKQFLIIRNIPCRKRISEETMISEKTVESQDGDWTVSFNQIRADEAAELADLAQAMHDQDMDDDDDDENEKKEKKKEQKKEEKEEKEEEEFEEGLLVIDDSYLDASVAVIKTRTYDVMITYDKYYQTPRVWLVGYDECRTPLTQKEIYEDIYSDYANKTVTMEKNPHTDTVMASIHPCKHAHVMKLMLDRYASSSSGKTFRVDQYMIIFLKFISTITPYIEFDQTGSLQF